MKRVLFGIVVGFLAAGEMVRVTERVLFAQSGRWGSVERKTGLGTWAASRSTSASAGNADHKVTTPSRLLNENRVYNTFIYVHERDLIMQDAYRESIDLEISILNSFVLPKRKERCLALLKTKSGRERLQSRLPHFHDFDPRFTIPILPSRQTSADIFFTLKKRGAPDECYVWSNSSKVSAHMVNLREALSSIVGWEPGTVLLCIPNHLGYYEGEEPNHRLILAR